MNISKTLNVSIAHISVNTENQLEQEPETNLLGLSVYKKGDFGYYIDIDKSCHLDKLPKDLSNIIKLAQFLQCKTVCLDCDIDTIDFLPVYNN